jgi:hypothetical protein
MGARSVVRAVGVLFLVYAAYAVYGPVTEIINFLGYTRHPSFDAPDFKKIYTLVQKGQIIPDQDGYAKLPEQFSSSTIYGNIYITRKGDLLMVLFPTWIGKGSNLKGYLHTSRPFKSTDIHKDSYSGDKDAIDVHVPGQSDPRGPEKLTEIRLEKKMSNGIYYVSRSID